MDEKVPGLKFQKGSAPGKYTTSKFSKFSKFQGVHSLIFMFVYFFTLCCIVDVHTKRCDSIANWSLMAIKKLFNAPNYYNYNTVKDKPELFTILIQSLYYYCVNPFINLFIELLPLFISTFLRFLLPFEISIR